VWPLLLIGLGTLWLLQNLGVLPAGMWVALAQLWPVLLILLGLDMLIGRRSTAGTVIVLIVGALVVAGSLTWAALRASQLPAGGTSLIAETMRGARQVSVQMTFDVGDLRVSALGPSDNLMEGQVTMGPGESVEQTYTVNNEAGQLNLAQKRAALFVPFLAATNPQTRWDIHLSQNLPLSLDINTGVGEANLDLSALNVTALNLTTGVGKTSVALPASGPLTAKVQSGIGELSLTLPPDVPTRITVKSGISSVQIPARFSRAGDVYATADFVPTGHYLELELTAGIGQVVVK
jgi:hypothetical protein